MISNKGSNQELINEVQRDIKGYERMSKRHPEDSNVHYVEAGAYITLAKTTGDSSYYDQALQQYNEAIARSPHNALYLVDRSKLYLSMGKPQLAAEDLKAAKASPKINNDVADMYISNTIKEITEALDNIAASANSSITISSLTSPIDTADSPTVDLGSIEVNKQILGKNHE